MRVIQIGYIEGYGTPQINHFNITSFNYRDSELPFFDMMGSLGTGDIKNYANENLSIPVAGEISIRISNSTFLRNNMTEKLRFITI